MEVQRKRLQRKQLSTVFALQWTTEKMKERDKTMLQKKTEYLQEMSSE